MWWEWSILLVVAEMIALGGALLYGDTISRWLRATARSLNRKDGW